ncbi:trypsin-4 [Daphnia magna]|nr:trypsin-4 [Daphnia magna]
MFYVLFFSVIVAFASGAPSGGTGRLIGGTQAVAGDFPFVVSISRQDQHICGGFIYNDRWVVTTAKCVDGKPIEELKVTVGSLSLITPDPEEQIITILNIVKFDQYEATTQKHDIALIELSRPIVFGSTAQPIRYDEIDELAQPWEAKIVGWGATFEGGAPATRLRWAPIDNLAADCRAYGIDEYIQNFMICAGSDSGTVSPCQYDEGTPLTQIANYGGVPEEIVVGIMSKNQGCADLSIPSIYTRLATYYSWLLQTAGQQPAPTRSLRQF